jgi:soluble lytic murein transglycosylase-like protein
MKTKNLIIFSYCFLISCFIFYAFVPSEKEKTYFVDLPSESKYDIKTPKSLIMFDLIERYSTEYNIPKYIAYNIAYKETRYKGPFHWRYNPYQVSYAGAIGAMQIMPGTSRLINKKSVPKEKLMYDLEFNVKTSMKLLNKLYKKYQNWSTVCGCYNTGKPIVNDYARFCASNLNYKVNWSKF